jgi:serine/threonine protein kinase
MGATNSAPVAMSTMSLPPLLHIPARGVPEPRNAEITYAVPGHPSDFRFVPELGPDARPTSAVSKVIGEGGFGCVISPVLINDTYYSNLVAKLMLYDEDYLGPLPYEVRVLAYIQELMPDTAQLFTPRIIAKNSTDPVRERYSREVRLQPDSQSCPALVALMSAKKDKETSDEGYDPSRVNQDGDYIELILENAGQDLGRILAGNPEDKNLAIDTCFKSLAVFRFVATLHGFNITHGDIKLENVMSDGKRLRLIDFGKGANPYLDKNHAFPDYDFNVPFIDAAVFTKLNYKMPLEINVESPSPRLQQFAAIILDPTACAKATAFADRLGASWGLAQLRKYEGQAIHASILNRNNCVFQPFDVRSRQFRTQFDKNLINDEAKKPKRFIPGTREDMEQTLQWWVNLATQPGMTRELFTLYYLVAVDIYGLGIYLRQVLLLTQASPTNPLWDIATKLTHPNITQRFGSVQEAEAAMRHVLIEETG